VFLGGLRIPISAIFHMGTLSGTFQARQLGSYVWLPKKDQLSYSECQIGPTASYWSQL
jgi:hypothetical protein